MTTSEMDDRGRNRREVDKGILRGREEEEEEEEKGSESESERPRVVLSWRPRPRRARMDSGKEGGEGRCQCQTRKMQPEQVRDMSRSRNPFARGVVSRRARGTSSRSRSHSRTPYSQNGGGECTPGGQ
jgi:hypothetical protein